MNGLNTIILSSIRSQLVLVISFREGKIRLKGERAREKGVITHQIHSFPSLSCYECGLLRLFFFTIYYSVVKFAWSGSCGDAGELLNSYSLCYPYSCFMVSLMW